TSFTPHHARGDGPVRWCDFVVTQLGKSCLTPFSSVLDVSGRQRLAVLGADIDEELAVIAEVSVLEDAFPARLQLKDELALVTPRMDTARLTALGIVTVAAALVALGRAVEEALAGLVADLRRPIIASGFVDDFIP